MGFILHLIRLRWAFNRLIGVASASPGMRIETA